MNRRTLLVLATAAAVIGLALSGWAFFGESDEPSPQADKGIADCPALLADVTFHSDPRAPGYPDAQDAVRAAMRKRIDASYDNVEKRDEQTQKRAAKQSGSGRYAARQGSKDIALVGVRQTTQGGYIAEGLEACSTELKPIDEAPA